MLYRTVLHHIFISNWTSARYDIQNSNMSHYIPIASNRTIWYFIVLCGIIYSHLTAKQQHGIISELCGVIYNIILYCILPSCQYVPTNVSISAGALSHKHAGKATFQFLPSKIEFSRIFLRRGKRTIHAKWVWYIVSYRILSYCAVW